VENNTIFLLFPLSAAYFFSDASFFAQEAMPEWAE